MKTQIKPYEDCKRAKFNWQDLSRENLEGVDFRYSRLIGTNLEEANLKGADVSSAYLIEAKLRGANLEGTNLKNSTLYETNLRDVKNIREANLEGIHVDSPDGKHYLWLKGKLIDWFNN